MSVWPSRPSRIPGLKTLILALDAIEANRTRRNAPVLDSVPTLAPCHRLRHHPRVAAKSETDREIPQHRLSPFDSQANCHCAANTPVARFPINAALFIFTGQERAILNPATTLRPRNDLGRGNVEGFFQDQSARFCNSSVGARANASSIGAARYRCAPRQIQGRAGLSRARAANASYRKSQTGSDRRSGWRSQKHQSCRRKPSFGSCR